MAWIGGSEHRWCFWSQQDLLRKVFPLGRHGPCLTWLLRACRTGPRVERHQQKVVEPHPPACTRCGQLPRNTKQFPIACSRDNEEEMGRHKAKGFHEQAIDFNDEAEAEEDADRWCLEHMLGRRTVADEDNGAQIRTTQEEIDHAPLEMLLHSVQASFYKD